MNIQINLEGEEIVSEQNLRDKFIVPPFSVLDTRQKYWQERKRYWLSLGIEDELGRDSNLLGLSDACDRGYLDKEGTLGNSNLGKTSIFDPFLCEVIYKWFCPKNGRILDPFAGGSSRGIVATKLGYRYLGIELRKEQVEANREQAKKIGVFPDYIIGDSEEKLDEITETFDFIFSCPPYYNLEVYSNLEGELSNMASYKRFLIKYGNIIRKSLRLLKYNRFACFVVSNIRNKDGLYLNLVGDTISLFCKNENVYFYNDIILLNAIGSLPIRVKKIFRKNRKVGRLHQNILLFYKGNNPENIQKLNFHV